MQGYPGELVILGQWLCCIIYTGFANLRFKKWSTAAIAAVFLVLKTQMDFLPVLAWAYTCSDSYVISRLVGTVAVFFLYVFPMYLYVFITTKDDWRGYLMTFFQIFAASELLEAFTWFCGLAAGAFLNRREDDFYRGGYLLSLFFSVLVLFLIKRKQEKVVIDWKDNPWMIMVSGMVILLCFLLFNFWEIMLYFPIPEGDVYHDLWMLSISGAGSFVYLVAVLGIRFINKHMVENQNRMEKQAVTDMLNLQYKQYLAYVENTDYLREQCHDLKHQIAAMRALPQSEVWGSYLDDLEEAVRTYDTWNATGNMVLDTLLTQKKQQCVRRDIQLTCKCEACDLSFLTPKDICSIFGNILDNAMEAVSTIEDKDRRVIHGEVGNRNKFLLIKFENCCEYGSLELEDKTGLPATTKLERNQHGIGLRNVQLVVEKYGGVMKLEKTNGWFNISIMIPQ